MLENAISNDDAQSESPFEAALSALLAEREAAAECGRTDKAVILALVARVPISRRTEYLARLAAIPPCADARGGDTFQKVVQFLDRNPRPEWKNSELLAGLAAAGTKTDAKQVGNFAAYLAKCGRFERLARGRYRDRFGNLIITSAELPTWNGPFESENE